MLTTNGCTLGVDLGVASIGLALIDRKGRRILQTAVRVFPAGVDATESDFAAGKDESRAKKRREARLARRQTERRKRRQHKVFRILQEHKFFPQGEPGAVMAEIDARLALKYPAHPGIPYSLRAAAIDRALDAEELGRAFYHLAQRRGFQSNRKAPVKEDEKPGLVKADIASLWGEMDGRTLGQYFASVDPHVSRIRHRYTERRMFLQEFEAIWGAQNAYHPVMTEALRSDLRAAMFYQRPLKDQSDKIGTCIYTGGRRAAAYELDAQHYRLLDKVNNLQVVVNEAEDRPLTAAERADVIAAMTLVDEMTYSQVATRILGLPKGTKFSIERGGEKKLHGNATYARFGRALNLRWEQMNRAEQEELVRLWSESDTDDSYRSTLELTGKFSQDEIIALLDVRLPEYRMGLALETMRRLIPRMEAGENQRVALENEFPEAFRSVEPREFLPPVLEALPELRNPAVTRPLTELRKAVNELIRKHGKPEKIRIELARDLKRNKKERVALTKLNRDREKERQDAKEALRPYVGEARGRDIELYLLWRECGEICPYSGKAIGLKALLDGAEFEVEHIIPRSRSLDDSFANKTLCWRPYNAKKGKQTPWEAFGATEEWEDMVDRVRKFGNRGKLKRFVMAETDTAALLAEFSSNQLNDTRYMSKLAGKYLGLLYGGVNDADGKKRVDACAGQLTAFLRRLWDLDRILNDVPRKSRDDHRHHAVDAATVAMVGQGMIQELAKAVERAEEAHLRFHTFQEPWDGFREHLREQILDRTVVSHRPERKLAGPLHEETLYGRPREEGGKNVVHIRKSVVGLSAKDVANIVDVTVRSAVEAKLAEVGGEFKKLEDDPPMLRTKKGEEIPIRKARIREVKKTVAIGKGARRRNVVTGDNHHMAVFAIQKHGKTSYVGDVVSRLEAMERQRKGLPVVRTERGPDAAFLFTLSMGDMVRWKDQLWRVSGVTGLQVELKRSTDARLKKELTSGEKPRPTINTFCAEGGRKVHVSRLGEAREAHD